MVEFTTQPIVRGWMIRFRDSVAGHPTFYGVTDDQILGVSDREHAIVLETRDAAVTIIKEVGWTEAEAIPVVVVAQQSRPAASVGEMPQDVRRLVIAARRVMDAEADAESLRELDNVAEEFASRVRWEDDPSDDDIDCIIIKAQMKHDAGVSSSPSQQGETSEGWLKRGIEENVREVSSWPENRRPEHMQASTPDTVSDAIVEAALKAYRQSIWDNPGRPYLPRDMSAAILAVVSGGNPSAALSDIAAERTRQIESEGWTPDHDDRHANGELALAAACYALVGGYRLAEDGIREEPNPNIDAAVFIKRWWPWDSEWWKPGNKRRDLIKAGALVLAEIERLDRRAALEHSKRGEE